MILIKFLRGLVWFDKNTFCLLLWSYWIKLNASVASAPYEIIVPLLCNYPNALIRDKLSLRFLLLTTSTIFLTSFKNIS